MSPHPVFCHLAYGRSLLPLELPAGRADVIEPRRLPALEDEASAVREALEQPIGAPTLGGKLRPGVRVAVAFTDITRATPNERLIPWLLDYLLEHGVKREDITLLNETGTHRGNSEEELCWMLTPAVARNFRVLNHDCRDLEQLVDLGTNRRGHRILLNKHLVRADVRVITGFIEPHFFAGFSGGVKGIMPGLAGLETVLSNHGSENIGDPRATFGVTEGNPLWEELRDIALLAEESFLLNVTLDEKRRITGVFAGDLLAAHRAGTEFVKASAMQRVERPYEIVITTNSGYPLDMNLYQGVKGMRAAAQIVRDGGLIILAAECREGVPAGSPHEDLLSSVRSPGELLARICTPGFEWPEQWAAHIQALVQAKARVHLFSTLPDDLVRRCHLVPCRDIAATVREELDTLGFAARAAVLPQGPLTIPYLAA